MAEQLIFDLPTRPAFARADFFVSPSNQDALAKLEGWGSWPKNMMILSGPVQSGKTHLAHVWAGLCDAQISKSLPDTPELSRPICIEDVHQIAGDTKAEERFFHLYNAATKTDFPLLITGVGLPQYWPIELPDLASRLASLAVAELSPPDDALLAAIMVKQFEDRQLSVDPKVISFLQLRIERSFAAVSETVEALDRLALKNSKPVSMKLARETLDSMGADLP